MRSSENTTKLVEGGKNGVADRLPVPFSEGFFPRGQECAVGRPLRESRRARDASWRGPHRSRQDGH